MKKRNVSTIPGFEAFSNYEVWEDGSVYNIQKKTKRNPHLLPSGHLFVQFYHQTNIKSILIPYLVLLAFSKERPTNFVQHLDKNKTNNHINNLKWIGRPKKSNDKISMLHTELQNYSDFIQLIDLFISLLEQKWYKSANVENNVEKLQDMFIELRKRIAQKMKIIHKKIKDLENEEDKIT